ncbi:MAG TPA: DMT family transporter [Candidatus Marinimicrobia bacterium]|jgi:drug/metabolite transporter (DMT)-like permease|nr:DMT family transporter [Candidatus Neomarinimicrobiota bacterium]MDP7122506.1 DMT family transporter [Candidatus Neomarinimicrobiota bacterium]MDP7483443.1 DMT family transporter [Candidatus Neomarinimicrobiota bacterium]MDP7528500.1 DMT family transporter [Candidatus Neomarinimicrobiota bacterium]MDP7715611.1 DMT family transporter [Candidatus Neomarinimicrobiota bacterium]|tara:strand:+ start:611 stop:1522 length:912 start_codon:yes stop_codon:yes gene_type:complete
MRNLKYLGPAAIACAAVLWSFDGLLRQYLSEIPSLMVVLLEHFFGAVLLTPLLLKSWKEVKTLPNRAWVSVLWVSLFGGLLGTFFYTKALSYVNYIDLSVVVLLQKFQPFFAIGLAAVLLREPLTKNYLICAVAAIVGGYLVTFQNGLPVLAMDDKTVIAGLMALCAAFAWGSSTVLGKHALKHLSFFSLTGLRLWITTFITVVVILFMGNSPINVSLSKIEWLTIVTIVLSTGTVALFIYYYGLKHVLATHATIYELFWPLSAMLIDLFIRERTLMPGQFMGALLLIGASIFLSRQQKNSTS